MGVRTLGKEDLSFAVDLTIEEGWFYTSRELELMLRLDPEGSFIFEEKGRPLGFATCVTYGRTGVLGHLIVSRQGRGRGISHSLIDAAVEYMGGKGADSMIVIATEEAVRIYEKHGFKALADIACQHSRLDDSVPRVRSMECARLEESDLKDVIRMDAEMFGDDRSRLIEVLHKESPERSFKIEREGKLEGFVFARPDHVGYNLGPWASATHNAKDAEALLRTAVATMGNGKLYSGSFSSNRPALKIMDGFEHIQEWRTVLMIRGRTRYDPKRMFGIAAFELG